MSQTVADAAACVHVEMRKHCFPDSFNVTCAHDEVIMMTAARYGRMSKGPCLTSDYQHPATSNSCPYQEVRASPRTTRWAAGRTYCTTSTASAAVPRGVWSRGVRSRGVYYSSSTASAPGAATASSPSQTPSCTIFTRARRTSLPTSSPNTSARKVPHLPLS